MDKEIKGVAVIISIIAAFILGLIMICQDDYEVVSVSNVPEDKMEECLTEANKAFSELLKEDNNVGSQTHEKMIQSCKKIYSVTEVYIIDNSGKQIKVSYEKVRKEHNQ